MSRVLWDILRGGATVLEPAIMLYFLFAFQRWNFRKSGKAFKIVSCIICAVIYSVLFIITYDDLYYNIIFKFLGNIALFFIFSLVLTREKPSYKLLAAFLCSAADLAVNFLMPADFEEVFTRFAAQIVKLIIYGVILQITVNKTVRLGKKEWIFIASVTGLSFAGTALLNSVSLTAAAAEIPILLTVEACLVIIAAVCFYMTLLLTKARQQSEQLKLLSQQNEFRRQYAENAKKQYDDIRRIRHDIKQSYSVVLTLLKENKIDEAFEFVRDSASRADNVEVLIDVGDDIINALLNAKLSDAKGQGITVLCNVENCLSDMDKIDLCNLLGNMLDNAVEACVKCQEGRRVIEVGVRSFGENRLIEISNSVSGDVIKQNKLLKTTKADTEMHGFGIKSIKSIAEKYGGSVSFVQEGDMFRCDVVLMK